MITKLPKSEKDSTRKGGIFNHRRTALYSGTYEKKGNQLIRQSDGLVLQRGERAPEDVTRSKAPYFLIDKSIKGGRYVSSLYGNGQFEYGGIRYEIVLKGGDVFVIQEVRK